MSEETRQEVEDAALKERVMERIEQRRRELGITVDDMLQRAELSGSTMRNWRRNKAGSFAGLARIARALQVSSSDLLGETVQLPAEDLDRIFADTGGRIFTVKPEENGMVEVLYRGRMTEAKFVALAALLDLDPRE